MSRYWFMLNSACSILMLAFVPLNSITTVVTPLEYIFESDFAIAAQPKPQKAPKPQGTPKLPRRKLSFPGSGQPGRSVAGGSRGKCPDIHSNLDLIALIPSIEPEERVIEAKTTLSHPTFWFFVPYSRQDVAEGEFSLQSASGEELLWAKFALPEKAGLVSLQLPNEASPLVIGESYRWYFKINCQPNASDSDSIYVSGWIRREQLKSLQDVTKQPDYLTYTEQGIWYDAIADILEHRKIDPTNTTLQQDWEILLDAENINLRQLKQQPIMGFIKLQPISN